MTKKKVVKKASKTVEKEETIVLKSAEMKLIELNNAKKKERILEQKVLQLEDRLLAQQIALLEKDRTLNELLKQKRQREYILEEETYMISFNKIKKRINMEDFSFNPWTGEVKNESKI